MKSKIPECYQIAVAFLVSLNGEREARVAAVFDNDYGQFGTTDEFIAYCQGQARDISQRTGDNYYAYKRYAFDSTMDASDPREWVLAGHETVSVEQYALPAIWASALINNDWSELKLVSDDKECLEWINAHPELGHCIEAEGCFTIYFDGYQREGSLYTFVRGHSEG